MAEHRIGDLQIEVTARREWVPSAGEVRGYTARFWEAVGDALERRHPGRVYRIRNWECRWRLTRASLRRPPDAALVDEVVRACERLEPAAPDEALDEAAPVVCFAGEADRVAAWWLARATGGAGHWAFADLERRPSLEAVLGELGPTGTATALRYLERAGGLEEALAVLPARRRAALPGVPRGPAPGEPTAPTAPSRTAAGLPPPGEDVPASTPPDGEDEAGAAGQVRPAPRPRAPGVRRSPAKPIVPGPADAEPWPAESAAPAPARGVEPEATAAESLAGSWTAWGGLAFLLRPLLECEVMETLWEACLEERAVLCRALSGLCGDDRVASALSGAERGDGPLVDADRLPDIRARLVLGLRRAVPRRGLAAWPELELARDPGGPAALRGTSLPWAIAAWPDGAVAPEEVGALAGSEAVSTSPAPAWHPREPRPEDAALLAAVIGVPATLLGLRAGWSGTDADVFCGRWLRHRALIVDDGELVELRFGADAVDVDLRRSGGDADPGWVPWLRRHVRLVFGAAEEL